RKSRASVGNGLFIISPWSRSVPLRLSLHNTLTGNTDKSFPFRRGKTEVPGIPVLGVAHSGAARELRNLNAFLRRGAVTALVEVQVGVGSVHVSVSLIDESVQMCCGLRWRQSRALKMVQDIAVICDLFRCLQVEP